jgi:hypothetical protein
MSLSDASRAVISARRTRSTSRSSTIEFSVSGEAIDLNCPFELGNGQVESDGAMIIWSDPVLAPTPATVSGRPRRLSDAIRRAGHRFGDPAPPGIDALSVGGVTSRRHLSRTAPPLMKPVDETPLNNRLERKVRDGSTQVECEPRQSQQWDPVVEFDHILQVERCGSERKNPRFDRRIARCRCKAVNPPVVRHETKPHQPIQRWGQQGSDPNGRGIRRRTSATRTRAPTESGSRQESPARVRRVGQHR